jgi:hypothetical protein
MTNAHSTHIHERLTPCWAPAQYQGCIGIVRGDQSSTELIAVYYRVDLRRALEAVEHAP